VRAIPSSGIQSFCVSSSPTGALLTYDAERRLTAWQNAPTSPTSQAWFLYDGEGHRVEQYVSGGSGNHTYYLPGNVEEVTPSGSLVKYYAAGEVSLWNLRISLRLSFPVTPHTIRRPSLNIAMRKESYHLLLGTCRMGAWHDEYTSDLT
jgi:hypothetical protein